METKLPGCPFCGGVKLTKMVGGPDSWHCDGCGADSSCWSRRAPGPATAKYLAWQRNEIALTYEEIHEMKAAFMAEHEPAPPAVASEPLPPEILEYLEGQT